MQIHLLVGQASRLPQLQGGQDAHPTRTLFLQKWDAPTKGSKCPLSKPPRLPPLAQSSSSLAL
jgi:hypothetical protein